MTRPLITLFNASPPTRDMTRPFSVAFTSIFTLILASPETIFTSILHL